MRPFIALLLCLCHVGFVHAQGAASGEASAPVGMRGGGNFQIYLGASSQVYRICKRAPPAGARDDCDVEITSTFKRVAVLEKQTGSSCSCVDVDGTNIEVKTTPANASCAVASGTLWYENLRNR